jgi:hypothetical protein
VVHLRTLGLLHPVEDIASLNDLTVVQELNSRVLNLQCAHGVNILARVEGDSVSLSRLKICAIERSMVDPSAKANQK